MEIDYKTISAFLGIISVICTGVYAFFASRKKTEIDSFKALIQANEDFRQEVRKDLIHAKEIIKEQSNEIEKLKLVIEGQNKEISLYKKKIEQLSSIIQKQTDLIKKEEESDA